MHAPVKLSQPHCAVNSVCVTARGGTSYARRYEIFCWRLGHENLYSAACLLLATNAALTVVTQSALTFLYADYSLIW